MAEYIEREKAWRKVNRAKNIEEALSLIDSIPAADVAEVVRCKDCKNIGKFGHNFVCCEIGDVVEETFFCSRGARMDGEGE